MHAEARAFIEKHARRCDTVVEFGGRDINGTIRDLFPDCTYVAVDLTAGPGVDVIADVTTWAPALPVDCVVCCEVLEHAPNPQAIIDSAHRALVDGGVFLLTAAADPREPHSSVDGGPLHDGEHYANIDPLRLADWLDEFTDVEIQYAPPDVYAVAVK